MAKHTKIEVHQSAMNCKTQGRGTQPSGQPNRGLHREDEQGGKWDWWESKTPGSPKKTLMSIGERQIAL